MNDPEAFARWACALGCLCGILVSEYCCKGRCIECARRLHQLEEEDRERRVRPQPIGANYNSAPRPHNN